MYNKIKKDSLDEIKVGQKRKCQYNDELTPVKVQKLEIKDENICFENEFKCDVCALVCKNKNGLSVHK